MRKIVIVIISLFSICILTACKNNSDPEVDVFVEFSEDSDGNLSLIKNAFTLRRYNELEQQIKSIYDNESDKERKDKLRLAPITTSTANLLNQIGSNIVAVSNSGLLDEDLKRRRNSGELLNFGSSSSAQDVDLEKIIISGANIILVSNELPNFSIDESIAKLIVINQNLYQDTFILIEIFSKYGDEESFIKGQNLLRTLKEEQDEALAIFEDKNINKVIAPIKFSYSQQYFDNKNSILGQILQGLNLNNIFANLANNATLNREFLLARDPDIIIFYAHGSYDDAALEDLEANIKDDETFKNLKAVKEDSYFLINSSFISSSADLNITRMLLKLASEL